MKCPKILLGLSMASLILTSACSNDDDINRLTHTDVPITFSAYAPKASRATITNSNLQQFRAYGFANGEVILNGVEVNRQTGGSWSYINPKPWPELIPVDFYTYVPIDVNADIHVTGSSPLVFNSFRNDGVTDFLYGVNLGETEATKQVKVYLRHALSQVRFRMLRNVDHNINVDVRSVEIMNTLTSGTFTFPGENTTATTTVRGTWSDLSDAKTLVLYNGDETRLSDVPRELNNTGIMYSIPQTVKECAIGDHESGFILRVRCRLSDKFTKQVTWPLDSTLPGYDADTQTAFIYYALQSGNHPEWLSGNRYVYTVCVGHPELAGSFSNAIFVDEYPDFSSLVAGELY